MKEIILKAIAPVLPWLLVASFLFVVFAIVFVYRKFSGSRAEAEQARQALELEISFFRKVGRLFTRKTDVVAATSTEDPNALTISRPIPAIPPPETKP